MDYVIGGLIVLAIVVTLILVIRNNKKKAAALAAAAKADVSQAQAAIQSAEDKAKAVAAALKK